MTEPLKVLTLKRVASEPFGTFGVLLDERTPFALTLELPWADNAPEKSCIPPGEYQCEKVISPNFGQTFEVKGVPNRSKILFHKGNFTQDTKGCILLGESFEDVISSKADTVVTSVQSSGKAFSEFTIRLIGKFQFKLVIL
jgi:hypothetical protein